MARARRPAALQDSEATFHLLFSHNPLPMWVYDVETLAFLEVNTTAVEHYGYSRDEFLRMKITDIRPPEDVPRLKEVVATLAAATRQTRHAGTWSHRRKDGRLDFDLAEDALHDAFRAALEQWPTEGIPSNPKAWLVSTGRFKAIDRIRRQSKFDPLQLQQLRHIEADTTDPSRQIDQEIEDDVLRLIFTCCHPALPPETRTAMTLREVCGLTTEEIVRAFLATPSTIAQRIVRGKAKIRETKIHFDVPEQHELPDRLGTVLQVIYLVFNEGYYASSGESVTRVDRSTEAIRLGRLLHDLLPDPEVTGLLALMLLHESRRSARTTAEGDLILLEDQDRSLWDRDMIEDGLSLVEHAFSSKRPGAYTLQAAIAALHAQAKSFEATDWPQIAGLYTLLLRTNPSPVIELNRAVAIAMHKGPDAGLKQIDAILERGELHDYHLAHSARAELCRKAGRIQEARTSWERALGLAQQEPERRFIERKLRELTS